MPKNIILTLVLLSFVGTSGCTNSESPAASTNETSSPAQAANASDIGVGPVSSLKLESEIQKSLASNGEKIFSEKCSACHKIEERYVGPALKGVTDRRKPEWIMNMILNPQEMTQKDATAQELLGEYMTQMTFQNLTQNEARAVLEYFRSNDHK